VTVGGPRALRAIREADSYGLVLLSIVAAYVLAASLTSPRAHAIVILVQIATVWLALRTARTSRTVLRVADSLLAVAGAAAIAGLLGAPGVGEAGALLGVSCLLYLGAPVAIVRHVFVGRRVDVETVLGAIAAYLLVGMFFAFAYAWLGEVQDGAFFGPDGDASIPQYLFFSFTTITTVGFGNLVPGGNPGQTLAVFEAVVGQLFLVVALAKAVSAWRPEGRPETDGGRG
jgi:hypothetical protein